jgi:hypothetical protein
MGSTFIKRGKKGRCVFEVESIFRRQQNRRGAAICFGDDPDLLVFDCSVGTQKTKAFSE